uniref:Response regulator n=2 Tax=Cohnella candidum TaxID=2674991 RepID=A0A3G3K017_9BACL|nr:response regulator [Cohnella candidum]
MMFRAIVVDDEPRVRRGLLALIPKLDPEWSVVGEAKNGLEAIDLVKREMPDLVITDIRMPHMNGLDLLIALKEYPVHVVILSGYGFFEYAQTAVKFGAFDYLLKPVKPPEIASLLQRLKEHKQVRDLPAGPAVPALNYSKWWKDWLTGSEEAESYVSRLRELLPKNAERFQMMAVEIDRFDELSLEDQWGDKQLVSFAVRNVIQDVLAAEREAPFVHLFTSGPQLYYVNAGGGCALDAAKRVAEEVRKWVKISVSVGLSETSAKFEALPLLYRHAGEALRNKWIHGGGIVSRFEDVLSGEREASGYPTHLDEEICRAVRAGDRDKALKGVETFLDEIKRNNVSFRLFQRFGLQLLSSVNRIVYENRVHDLVAKEASQPQDLFQRDFGADEFMAYMGDWIGATISALDWNRQQRHNRTIEKAIEFIHKNYAKDISLEDVALHAKMSGSYFSSYFKQETGDNFVEYLTRLRMDKAKSLMMNSELRLYEISQMVGYQDVKYFSRLFKRHAGVTPQEYRQFFYRKEDS